MISFKYLNNFKLSKNHYYKTDQTLNMPLSPFIISTDFNTPNTKTISIKKKIFSSQSPAKQKSKGKSLNDSLPLLIIY